MAAGALAGEARSSLLNGLAILCYEAHDFARAGELLQQALLVHPGDATLLINLAITSNALGRNQEAATFANKAVKVRPRDAGAWGAQGYLYAAIGKFDEAIVSLSKAIELAPRAASIHAALAILYDLVQRTDETARELELARKLAQGTMLSFIGIYEAALAGSPDHAMELARAAIRSNQIPLVDLQRDPNLSLLIDPAQLEDGMSTLRRPGDL